MLSPSRKTFSRQIRMLQAALAAACMATGIPSHAEIVLKTAYVDKSPPRYQLINEGGRPTMGGMCVDIMRAIERVAPDIRFVSAPAPMPQARMLSLVETGEFDAAFCFNKNPERERSFSILPVPLYEVRYKVAVRADDNVDIQSFEDIRKLGDKGIILVNFGSASADYLHGIAGLHVDSTGVTQEINLRKLVNGRGRFHYRHELGLRAELVAGNFERDVKILPAVLDRQEQYVLLSRAVDPLVAQHLYQALGELKASGELEKLKEKYVGD